VWHDAQVLDGLRWCGKSLMRDRRTRAADSAAGARLRMGEAWSGNASIAGVAQRAQRGEFGSLGAFQAGFRAAAQALLLQDASSGGERQSDRCAASLRLSYEPWRQRQWLHGNGCM
jgi:hypothetical protein